MIEGINIFPGFKFNNFSEVSVQFLDGGFSFDEIFIINFGDYLPGSGVEEGFLFKVLHGSGVDFSFHLSFNLSLKSVGGISQDPVMFIASNHDGNSVFWLFEQ